VDRGVQLYVDNGVHLYKEQWQRTGRSHGSETFYHHEGYVIGRGLAGLVHLYGGQNAVLHQGSRKSTAIPHQSRKTIVPELFLSGIHRLGYPVCIQDQQITRHQRNSLFGKGQPIHNAQ